MALLACAIALPAHAATGTNPDADDGVEFTPTGVAMYDAVAFDSERGNTHTDKFRSVRLGFKLEQAGRWRLNVEHEFTDRSTPDANLQWFLPRGQVLRVGQFKQPFLLEDATSSRQTPLMEASLLGSFAIGRRIGVEYSRASDDSSIGAAVFGQRLDGRNDGIGMALRGSRVLARNDAGLLHLGLGVSIDRPDSEVARISSKSETGFAPYAVIDTGSLAGAERIARYGVEALTIRGAWSWQAELAQVAVDTRDGDDFRGHGGYAMASWSPSGHARSYRKGSVGAPALDGRQAWELFLRYSQLDLDDGRVRGGEQADWALGLTWYVNPHLRLMANYVRADSERRGIHDQPRVAQVRAQFAF